METRRVFRDYQALVVATGFYLERLREMLDGLGFARVQTTDQDKQAPFIIKQQKPQLVVVTRNLPIFSGMQLLIAARKEEQSAQVPFLILGDKNDLKPGALAEKVRKEGLADMIAEPVTEDSLGRAVLNLLDPGIDRNRERAYADKDLAQEAVKVEDWAEAERLFKESLEAYGQDVECVLGLANALNNQGKNEEAEQIYFRALEIDNASLKAFLGLAELYEKQEENELAVDVLRQALPIAQSMEIQGSSKAKIHFYLGEFELRLKRLSAAEEAFSEAIQYDPENAQLRSDIGDSYAEHGHFQKSEEHYKAALTMDPDMAHTFNRLGIAYRKQGKYDRALALYEKARIRHPEDEHLLFNMARTYYEVGDLSQSSKLLNQALAHDPEFKMARILLNKIQEHQDSQVQEQQETQDQEQRNTVALDTE